MPIFEPVEGFDLRSLYVLSESERKGMNVGRLESSASVPLIVTLRLIGAGGKFTCLSNLIKFTSWF
jgi:hypothetical protein